MRKIPVWSVKIQTKMLEKGITKKQLAENLNCNYNQLVNVMSGLISNDKHFDSDSEFAQAIQGMNSDKAWALVDELVATLWAVNKPLYNALMRQIKS